MIYADKQNLMEEMKMKTIGLLGGMSWIGLLIQQKDSDLPLFDTTKIHASKAAKLAIEK